MATVIDISILNSVTIIIVFMLVFIGGWGMMSWVKPFGDGKGASFYGLIAFLVAILVALSRKTVSVILTATPWLILLLFIAFFFIFFAKVFGTADSSITNAFTGPVKGWLIFFVAVIILFAIGGSYGQDLLATTVPSQGAPVDVNNLPEGTIVNSDGTIVMPDGSLIVPDATGTVSPDAGVATGSFGTNLIATLFHPKILGVIFLFLLGTLTILLLNTGTA